MKSTTSTFLFIFLTGSSCFLLPVFGHGQVFSDVSLSIFERLSTNSSEALPNPYTPNVLISRKKGSEKLYTLTFVDERSHIKVVITDYIFLRTPSISLYDANHDGKPDILLEGIDSNGYLASKTYQYDGVTNWVEFLPPLDNLPSNDPNWISYRQDTVVISKNIPAAQFTSHRNISYEP